MAEPQPGEADGARPLRQPAQGPDLRRRAQPARAAGRHPPHGRARRDGARDHGRAAGPATRRPMRGARWSRTRPTSSSPPRESLYLILTSQAREIAARRRARHRRRGARHRRHEARRAPGPVARAAQRPGRAADPQRIGLSATQRPLEAIGAFLGGGPTARSRSSTPGARKELDLEVIVPVEDMSRMGDDRRSTRRRAARPRGPRRGATRSGPRSTRGCSSSSARIGRRWSS